MRKLFLTATATAIAVATMPTAPEAYAGPPIVRPVTRAAKTTGSTPALNRAAVVQQQNQTPGDSPPEPPDPSEPPGGNEPPEAKPIRRSPPNREIEFSFETKPCWELWQHQGVLTPLDQFHLNWIDAAHGVMRSDVVIEGKISDGRFVVKDPDVFRVLRAYDKQLVRARFVCSLNGELYDLPHRYHIVLYPIAYGDAVKVAEVHRSMDREHAEAPSLPAFVTSIGEERLAYRLVAKARFNDALSVSIAH